MLGEQLGIDPSAETVQVYLEALRDQPGGAPARVPAETTSFIGRESDLAALAGAVTGPGLVTVTGKGGVGKSRLATHIASRRGGFDGGRLWVPLAAVAEDALVASSVALDIGVQLGIEDAALRWPTTSPRWAACCSSSTAARVSSTASRRWWRRCSRGCRC